MRNFRDSKAMATTIRDELAGRGVTLSRAESLEIIAKAFGAADWNTLSARIRQKEAPGEPVAEEPRQSAWPEVARPFYERHLTPEERGGQWTHLFQEARALNASGADPGSDPVLDLADRWLRLSEAVNGGNRELRAKYAAAYRDALADPQVAPKLPLSRELLDWFGPALKRAEGARSESGA